MYKKIYPSLVLVKVDSPETQDENGVYIQEEWKTQKPIGTVEAVADNVTFCKIGDKIEFERFSAIPAAQGKDYRWIKEDLIRAVLSA